MIGKAADSDPARMVTLAGVVAIEGVSLLRATTIPPVGALPVRVAVPVAVTPPITEEVLSLIEERAGGVIDRVALFDPPPNEPVITGFVRLTTGVVVMAKVAVFTPAITVTEAGTLAADGLLLDRFTT